MREIIVHLSDIPHPTAYSVEGRVVSAPLWSKPLLRGEKKCSWCVLWEKREHCVRTGGHFWEGYRRKTSHGFKTIKKCAKCGISLKRYMDLKEEFE